MNELYTRRDLFDLPASAACLGSGVRAQESDFRDPESEVKGWRFLNPDIKGRRDENEKH
jgi:hypothetical protein